MENFVYGQVVVLTQSDGLHSVGTQGKIVGSSQGHPQVIFDGDGDNITTLLETHLQPVTNPTCFTF